MAHQDSLLESADWWDHLADEEISMARWEISRGLPQGSVQTFYNRARTYRECAASMRQRATRNEATKCENTP